MLVELQRGYLVNRGEVLSYKEGPLSLQDHTGEG